MNLLDIAFAELTRSNADRRHPFKTMVLSTHSEYPEQRTVVNRGFKGPNKLKFYTDSRTPKCEQILSNPKISLLFYHPKKKLQLRVKGIAHIIQENTTTYQEALSTVKNSPSKSDYQTKMRPGSPLHSDKVDYEDEIHLAVIDVNIEHIDIVLLSTSGHQRMSYHFEQDQWKSIKLVP